MNTTVKSSVSLRKPLWQKLKKYSNRSNIINTALELFFMRENDLKSADETYWKKVQASLRGENSEYTSLNLKGKELTSDALEKHLWK